MLAGDVVLNEISDDLAMIVGPAYLGYVCSGHRGSGSGRMEEASLSVHRALDDVARGVALGRARVVYVCVCCFCGSVWWWYGRKKHVAVCRRS